MKKINIDDLNLQGKKILTRVDFNVPIENGVVKSTKRIIAALPTIKKIIKDGGRVILFSHLGRIENAQDKKNLSLLPVAKILEKLINQKVKFINTTRGKQLETAIANLKNGEILMFENTRYEDINDKAESKNNWELGKYWASLGDIFINDAFGTAHRSHASNVGIANNISVNAIGYLIMKELKMLDQGLCNPQHPFVAIIGGAKVSDKITVIENLINKVDKILIGGGMAYTFLKAQGYQVGKSLIEPDYVDLARKTFVNANGKIILPVDYAFAKEYADSCRQESQNNNLNDDEMGLDIGTKTIKFYQEMIKDAKTIIWNGPMGVTEFSNYKKGTEALATAIAELDDVFAIVGGGDSAAAIINLGFEKQFSHISTGGGATLQYMEGKSLPGIEIINNKE